MFKFIHTLLLVLAGFVAMAQQVTVPNPPLEKAPNVSIGTFSVWSAYPDRADFILNFVEQRLAISVFHGPDDSDYCTTHYPAIVGQVAPNVYRAEVDESFWIEVHTETGETFWHDHCLTTSYRLPCQKDHTASLR